MPVPTLITDLSTTIASNSPAGGDTPADGDNHIRALAAFIASIMANSGNGWTSPYAVATALNASNLTSGTVPTARLPTDLQTASAGTYTPTLTAITNVTSLTPFVCQWMRVGSVVAVSGLLVMDPTAANTNTQWGMSLPVASNFAASEQCGGTGASKDVSDVTMTALITADSANDRANFSTRSSADTGSNQWAFSFTYRIV